MATLTFDKKITALLVVDPYNDFISDGGKIWNLIKGVAEEGPDWTIPEDGQTEGRHATRLKRKPTWPLNEVLFISRITTVWPAAPGAAHLILIWRGEPRFNKVQLIVRDSKNVLASRSRCSHSESLSLKRTPTSNTVENSPQIICKVTLCSSPPIPGVT